MFSLVKSRPVTSVLLKSLGAVAVVLLLFVFLTADSHAVASKAAGSNDVDGSESQPETSASSSNASDTQTSASDTQTTPQSSAQSADKTPPKAEASDFEVVAGESISYKKHIKVSDDTDKAPSIEIDSSKVNIDTVGKYPVVYTVTDKSGNKTVVQITVTVKKKAEEKQSAIDEYISKQAKAVIAKITNKKMDDMHKAYAIFYWTRHNITYTGDSNKTNYRIGARDGFKKHSGDCFTYFSVAKVLLDAAGIENRDMIKVRTSEKDARHFWSIVHINGGWYHFDSTPFKAGHDYFFMATDAEMKAWDKKYYPGTHVYKTEGMPEFATKSVQSRVDYSSPKLK